MSWFNRRSNTSKAACAHDGALPRWDKVEETGQQDRISRLYCPHCNTFLPPPVANRAS